jgi:hypothetical protein
MKEMVDFKWNTCRRYTDKKENLIFLIFKEIQSGEVATAPVWISFYMYMYQENLIFFCISVHFSQLRKDLTKKELRQGTVDQN